MDSETVSIGHYWLTDWQYKNIKYKNIYIYKYKNIFDSFGGHVESDDSGKKLNTKAKLYLFKCNFWKDNEVLQNSLATLT